MARDAGEIGDDGDGLSQRRYVIRGRVQGVGFRWWTQREACALKLTGSVCNRPDGAVEVTARGTARSLQHLESRLREGPPASRVDDVELHPMDATAVNPLANGFEIVRPT